MSHIMFPFQPRHTPSCPCPVSCTSPSPEELGGVVRPCPGAGDQPVSRVCPLFSLPEQHGVAHPCLCACSQPDTRVVWGG